MPNLEANADLEKILIQRPSDRCKLYQNLFQDTLFLSLFTGYSHITEI